MEREEDIFARRTLRPETLAPFGFVPEEGGWRYAETFLNGDFRADVFITPEGAVEGRVTDLSVGEEYLPIRAKAHVGPFVGLVREAYGAVLRRIAESCFAETPFASAQANRVARRITETYGEAPDYPFGDPPEPAVFRYPPNRKWYAIVMRVRRQRVTKEPVPPEDTPFIDVMNVKVGRGCAPLYTDRPGVYPAYHMSHTDWVSILLDGTVPDGDVMALIDRSRGFAAAKRETRNGKTGDEKK